jgi:hypothetical protein
MSGSNGPVPRHFQPMVHNDGYTERGAESWGSTWGPHGQQRPNAAHITGFDHSQTPLALGDAAAENTAPGSVAITPGTGSISLQGVSVSCATVTGTLTVAAEAAPISRIVLPPATRLISLLGSVLAPQAFETIIKPYIAQEQHEYFEALVQKDFTEARVIDVRLWVRAIWLSIHILVAPIIRLIRRGE